MGTSGRLNSHGQSSCGAAWARIHSLLLPFIAFIGLSGCAVSKVLVPFGVEPGHTLSLADYARLQNVADALPGDLVFYRTKDQPPPIQTVPLVGYAYSFRPNIDVAKLDGIVVGPFAGDPGDAAKTAADLPAKLARRLTDDGLPSRVGPRDVRDAYVLSGTVTRADTAGHAIDAPTATQVEATVSRNGEVLGVMQVNAFVPAAATISPVVQLLSLALQDSRAYAVSVRISAALRRAKSGQREGAARGGGTVMTAPEGTQYRQAPAS